MRFKIENDAHWQLSIQLLQNIQAKIYDLLVAANAKLLMQTKQS